MKFTPKVPARTYTVGAEQNILIKDCGTLNLNPDEQITFITEENHEYDVTRKSWGFYATPSLNGRLKRFSLRAVLVKSKISAHFFILLVEEGKEPFFFDYIKAENLEIVVWLDKQEELEKLSQLNKKT